MARIILLTGCGNGKSYSVRAKGIEALNSFKPRREQVYVANNADGTVSMIDTTTNTVVATVQGWQFPVRRRSYFGW